MLFCIQDLKDGLNYGLYCPPINGRAGKFLDEERLLQDYPLPGAIGFLEVSSRNVQFVPTKMVQFVYWFFFFFGGYNCENNVKNGRRKNEKYKMIRLFLSNLVNNKSNDMISLQQNWNLAKKKKK